MHAPLLWLLVGLAAVGLAAWRVAASLRRAAAMRAEREQAMAIALAQAQAAARQTLARKQAEAQARPPAITRTVTRPPAAPRKPAPPPPDKPVAAAPGEAQLAARAEAQRLALEAARRAKAQKAARVQAERQAARDEAPRPAAPGPAPEAPVALAPQPQAQPQPPAAPAVKTPAETVILLADDSRMVRVKTSRLLEGNAYRVVTAVDGLDAVRQLESVRPDLVITDVDMPGMDGFGLARHLRGNASTAHIPIVMITSAEDRHRDDALREGVGLVLGKPYPEDALLAHIRSFSFSAGATA
jgi:CheY-like chemotaxis protein